MFLVNRASLLYMYCILLFGSYSKSRSNSYIDILLSQPNLKDQVSDLEPGEGVDPDSNLRKFLIWKFPIEFLLKIKTRHISKRDRK
ncbi:uncharacterized protein F5891DRAFT_1000588 [Suillus fuscotomentosus]|uniref:Uncharacterized protein n=1 Tax=Suillus fuscotomentosus TaxID=1912939 RepID=A0AAD4EJG6_9AGAM|nr:uncharacterized protein F5891DRAFT_1000588 [Suillus fuscotomentosus]KAG1907221.1 hypothetical protein F5891DRAFT_1000588 [Suillus fuscotomentosus]